MFVAKATSVMSVAPAISKTFFASFNVAPVVLISSIIIYFVFFAIASG